MKKQPVFVGEDTTCALCDLERAVPPGKAYWDSPISQFGGSWGYLCRRHGIHRSPGLATRVTTTRPDEEAVRIPKNPGPVQVLNRKQWMVVQTMREGVDIFTAIEAVATTAMAHPEWDMTESHTWKEWEERNV